MNELRELYQQVIIDHNKNPRNYHKMECANRQSLGINPLCGDKLALYLQVNDDNIIQEVSFVGSGCAISTASASLMTEALKGKSVEYAEELFQQFHDLITQEKNTSGSDKLGKLEILAGVKAFPARVKCATLAWHTLKAAIDNTNEEVTTE